VTPAWNSESALAVSIRLICYYLRGGAVLVARGLTRSTAFAAGAVAPAMSGVCYVRRQPKGVAFTPIANVRRKVRSQTKEHVFPPIPQQRSSASRVVPRAVYWSHLTAATSSLLFFAFHLCRASDSLSLAWHANLEPDIAKYKGLFGPAKRSFKRAVRRRQRNDRNYCHPQ
jgi:hypothetical protein